MVTLVKVELCTEPQVTVQPPVALHELRVYVSVDNKVTLLEPVIIHPEGGGGCATTRLTFNNVNVSSKNWATLAQRLFIITNQLCVRSNLLFHRLTDGMVLNRFYDIMVLIEYHL
jgi:hypothetical protein